MNKKLIHKVFEKTVQSFSDKIAIEEENQSIQYYKLNEFANILASLLMAREIKSDDIVGILLPSGIQYVSSILGVLKAGAIFLPMDINLPQKRNEYILNKTKPKIIITSKDNYTRCVNEFNGYLRFKDIYFLIWSFENGSFILWEGNPQDLKKINIEKIITNPEIEIDPDSGNYIIFTSGSTGEPKAILGCHKSLSHFIHWEIKEFELDDRCKVSQLAPVTFDVSFRDIFVPLISGGVLCIPDDQTRTNIGNLTRWLNNSRISLAHIVPSIFRLIIKEVESEEKNKAFFENLKYVLLAGEPLYGKDLQHWREIFEQRIELVNLYGPSETTLAKIFNRMKSNEYEPNSIIPLGLPISNTVVLILQDNRLCNIGEIGEIHIKTPFRSKGYYLDEELNKLCFIQNPLNNESEDIIYKTGDMGKYLPDRSIAFIGRLDKQIKMNGIRVELTEIENVLLKNSSINETIVIPFKNPANEYNLACYYTEHDEISVEEIREFLGVYLPSFMIPAFFIRMEKFPLNINGKIDRKALPKPEEIIFERIKYEPPQNEIQSGLVAIWSEILELKKIGINNQFIDIGGNSLHAIRVISKIFRIFNIEITIRDFFESGTIKKLSEVISEKNISSHHIIHSVEYSEYYDLSHSQRRMWILAHFANDTVLYNMNGNYLIEGKINYDLFEKSLQIIIDRHEILRTYFVEVEGEPKQKIFPKVEFKIDIEDVSNRRRDDESIIELIKIESMKQFELNKAPLLRIKILKFTEEIQIILMNMHHIIGDGWSMNILIKELCETYAILSSGEIPGYNDLGIHYKDYAGWQNQQLKNNEKFKSSQIYWKDKLDGQVDVLEFPADFPRPEVQSFNGKTIRHKIGRNVSEELSLFCREKNVTHFAFFISIIYAVVYRYTNQEDIILGTVVAGRDFPELESQIGFYANTIALRNTIKGEQKFLSFLESVKRTIHEDFEHKDYPFDKLVEEINLKRDMSRNPIFDIMVVLQNMNEFEIDIPGVRFKEYLIDLPNSKFDLTITIFEKDEGVIFEINYNTDLFLENRIKAFACHMEEMIKSILLNPDCAIGKIEILSDNERNFYLNELNQTKCKYPEDKTIIDLFEEQVKKTPDNQAVEFDGCSISYKKLDLLSTNLANHLIDDHNLKPGEVVGIAIERSEKIIIAILSILKAGAVYLPIDPDYPPERIKYMIEDSCCSLLLISGDEKNGFKPVSNCKTIDVEKINETSNKKLKISYCVDDTAYIIYTSGSTGKPNGVMVTHRNVVRLMKNDRFLFNFNENDVWTMFHSVTFDFSVWEMYGALLYGGKLIIIPKNIARDPQKYLEILLSKKVTVLNQTPAYFYQLSEEMIKSGITNLSLRYVIFGGEALKPGRLQEFAGLFPLVRLINMYGITETTVHVTFKEIGEKEITSNISNIGKPIPTLSCYIMNEWQKLMPVNVPGEICVAGDGVSKGYINRDDLNKKRFVRNPYFENEIMYRSGDLAKILPDGEMVYLGRVDFQVKIRGYRIELGEIEKTIIQYREIKEAIVIAAESVQGSRELVAYIVMKNKFNVEDLRNFLKSSLPDYMIPSYFVELDKIPITPNGKIDKKALPEYHKHIIITADEYIIPRNALEMKLAEIFGNVLGVEKINLNENFFNLGGDSIKAIQIISRLYQAGLKLEIADIFRGATIADIAVKIKSLEKISDQSIVTGVIPLTPIQKWFFEEKNNLDHFNQSMLLISSERLDDKVLKEVLSKIIEHHDMLRASFRLENGEYFQDVSVSGKSISFNTIDLRDEKDASEKMRMIIDESHAGMNLLSAPLIKVIKFELKDFDQLIIVIHHLVIDGVSWRILVDDLTSGYKQGKDGENVIFPKKTDSYKKWSQSLQKYSSNNIISQEIEFWNDTARKKHYIITPDNFAGSKLEKCTSIKNIIFSETDTKILLEKSLKKYNLEISDLILTSLLLSLKKWKNIDEVKIALEGHGREDIDKEINISRTIGWFTTIYPVILEFPEEKDTGSIIKQVKETLRKIPKKGIGYGILKYLSNFENLENIKSDDLSQISFNYLGHIDNKINNGLFTISLDPDGKNISPEMERRFELALNAIIIQDQLEISLDYSNERFDERNIINFLNIFKNEILNISQLCSKTDIIEFTPSDFIFNNMSLIEYEKILDYNGLLEKDIENVYPLSNMQEGMLYHYLKDVNSNAYLEQITIKVTGNLDPEIFEESWNELLKRHDIFRTSFITGGVNRPLQFLLKKRKIEFNFIELLNISTAKQEKIIADYQIKSFEKPFDLSKDVLMRFAVFQVSEKTFTIIWNYHHILMDGWCISILLNEQYEIYQNLKNREILQVPKIPQYKEYIKWLIQKDNKDEEIFWKEYLKNFDKKSELPRSRKSYQFSDYLHSEHVITIPESIAGKLRTLAIKNNVTINVVIQAIWAILLEKYNDHDDVVYGITVSGRPAEIKGIEEMIGLFINTCPIRIKMNADERFKDSLQKIQQSNIHIEKYQYLPLADIQNLSELKQNLFDHLLIFENYPVDREKNNDLLSGKHGLKFESFEISEHTNYDLAVMVIPEKNIEIKLNFNSNIYLPHIINNIDKHLHKIIDSIIRDENIIIKDLDILSVEEKNRILFEFNSANECFNIQKSFVDLFEESVVNHPDKIALAYYEKELSYSELNISANKIGYSIHNKSAVVPDSIVGIMIERSDKMVAGIIGILKSGAAYLPIDPDYPDERIRFILEDSRCGIILTEKKFIPKFEGIPGLTIIDFDSVNEDKVENLNKMIKPEQLAYVIYTSGSTGSPKGVMIEHRNLTSFCENLSDVFNLDNNDSILAITTITFDISILEILCSLTLGLRVVIASKEIVNSNELIQKELLKKNISVLQITPSRLDILLSETGLDSIKGLKTLIVGGEEFPESLFEQMKSLTGTSIYNVYGPTETTIWSTAKNLDNELLNIGKPLKNESIYILSENNELAPVGVIGEICIGGSGVGRGYLNNSGLTSDKFVQNPFREGEKIYKTGDLGRWLDKGDLEFIGRKDTQVKIHGFRIETGEIESIISKIENIEQVVVVANEFETNDKTLVAYLKTSIPLSVEDIKIHLRKFLPEYMIPAYYVFLKQFPLLPSGKINRKQLPLPEISDQLKIEVDTKSLNVTQQKLVNIFKDVLKKNNVGLWDNFFRVGGHSLKAIQVISRINRTFNVDLSLKHLFDNPNIIELEKVLNTKTPTDRNKIVKAPSSDYYDLSPGQKRLWIIEKMADEASLYNMSSNYIIEGDLNLECLKKSLEKLIERHEILRTSFIEIDNIPIQKIEDRVEFEIPFIDLSLQIIDKNKISEIIYSESSKGYKLNKAPLFRVKIMKIGEKEHLLLFNIHHIISDAWSLNILFKELVAIYHKIEAGENLNLPELRIQYKDYSCWQNERIQTDKKLKKSGQFWKEKLNGELGVLNFPTDKQRPLIPNSEGQTFSYSTGPDLKNKINDFSLSRGITTFTTLVGIIKSILYRYTNQEDIILGTAIAGRGNIELEDQLGFYVNTIVLRDEVKGEDSFEELLNKVKITISEGFEHQDYPFDLLVEELDIKRDMARNPIFDIMLVLQKEDNPEILPDGLKFKEIEDDNTISRFDLTIRITEKPDNMVFEIDYKKDLYTEKRISRFTEHLDILLKEIINNPSIKIGEVEIITPEEKLMIEKVNNNYFDFPKDKTIIEVFEKIAEKYRHNLAVIFEDIELSHAELNNSADTIGNLLSNELKAKPGSVIGLMMQRDENMITGMLGIWKAGCVYMPMDPEYPEERLQYMIDDSGCKVIITNTLFNKKLKIKNIFNIKDYKNPNTNISQKGKNNKLNSIGSDPAYIIYTSGTTGKPKGVLLNHTGFVNMSLQQVSYFGLLPEDRNLFFSSISFDGALSEIFLSLFSGAALVLINQERIKNLDSFRNYLIDKKVTVAILPPSYLSSIHEEYLRNLRILITAGEPAIVRDALFYSRTKKYFNAYGPTETSVCATYYQVEPQMDYPNGIPIGIPLGNVKTEILNEWKKRAPIGVIGEIYIGGIGLAKGYIGKPELTKEKFIQSITGELLYKSGDLGRWNDAGLLEYIGRKDDQVKIRGFRIEIDEIKKVLDEMDYISESAIKIIEIMNGRKELAVYFTASRKIDYAEVRDYLKNRLPQYMIPAYIIQVEEIPLTINGKVDKEKLPAPGIFKGIDSGHILPGNLIEEKILTIVKKILDNNNIFINNNFFETGGNSLDGIRLLAEIKKNLGIGLQFYHLDKFPVIRDLAGLISKEINNKFLVKEENYILLNEKKIKNIFSFPSIPGYGIEYKTLANYFSEHSIYSFDFFAQESAISDYQKIITKIQPAGNYILLGYSTGGILAFNTAIELINSGHSVSDLILIDSPADPEQLKWKEPGEFENEYRHVIKNQQNIEIDDNDLQDRIKKNLEFIRNLKYSSKIYSNIHYIKSNDILEPDTREIWEEKTSGNIKFYSGSGSHHDMLKEPDLRFNVEIILKSDIEDDKAQKSEQNKFIV